MRAVVGLALVFGGLGLGVLVITGHLPASSSSGTNGTSGGSSGGLSEPGNPISSKNK